MICQHRLGLLALGSPPSNPGGHHSTVSSASELSRVAGCYYLCCCIWNGTGQRHARVRRTAAARESGRGASLGCVTPPVKQGIVQHNQRNCADK